MEHQVGDRRRAPGHLDWSKALTVTRRSIWAPRSRSPGASEVSSPTWVGEPSGESWGCSWGNWDDLCFPEKAKAKHLV